MSFFKRIFTWWNGQTMGTQLFTWRYGAAVGKDSFGNVYYQTADGKRRWVVYPGYAEASSIPAEWHSWMHHTIDIAPSQHTQMPLKPWEKPHQPNLTGTALAYRPPGSLVGKGKPRTVLPDYDAWKPD